ncbi:hypothetical protein HPP92_013536 [Vanilla planifolia]|uniref:Exopolygalacturonase n=1 Tax=Vanilla planifolia TaxID=51239 RepID=A0A835UY36_VANPL|nr:hypothetical protein HPP92_013536 [Vanilla planifolia]
MDHPQRHVFQLILLILPCFSTIAEAAAAANQTLIHDVTAFGAKADGETVSTKAFLSAWAAACSFPAPSTIKVPSGFFAVGQVKFCGPCKSGNITFQIDGTLVAPSNYTAFYEVKGNWIQFDGVDGVSIFGGTLNGRGSSLWSCKLAGGRNCPDGAASLAFTNSKEVVISGLTSIDSELYHIVIDRSQRVTVEGVKVSAPATSPNTDGIHVQMSAGVIVTDSTIDTGDDCISVGPGTRDLWIEKVSCGPSHGISIGSLGKEPGEQGVENVTVRSVLLSGTENGLRIKTWGSPSDGFVRGVTFDHAIMKNVRNPIIIDQNYCPNEKGCSDQSSGVKISDVSYRDIRGSSATLVAVSFDCSAMNPCSGISLQDIDLAYEDQPAMASCNHAEGLASGLVHPPSCLH